MDKTMEKEYKWRADENLLGQALLWASSRIGSQSRTINMESSYFDTADGLLKEHQAALRLRRENDRSVCCMKLRNTDTPDGMRAHEEYQCEAVSLLDGLRRLPELGAPNDLCERALAADLQEICTVSFGLFGRLIEKVLHIGTHGFALHRFTAGKPEVTAEMVSGAEPLFNQRQLSRGI